MEWEWLIEKLTEKANAHFVPILSGMVLFVLFWFLASVIRFVLYKVSKKLNRHQKSVIGLASKILGVIIVILGFITALGTMGIDITGLVTGLGITGFAMGFAFKDALSNVLAGIMLVIYRPFKEGEEIEIDKYQGVVKSVDLRYITLESKQQRILVPNTLALSKVVTVIA